MNNNIIVWFLRVCVSAVGVVIVASVFGLMLLEHIAWSMVMLVGLALWALVFTNLERSSLFLHVKTDRVVSDFRCRRIDYATAWERLVHLQEACGHRSILRLHLQEKADEVRRLFIERQPKHPRAVRNDPYY